MAETAAHAAACDTLAPSTELRARGVVGEWEPLDFVGLERRLVMVTGSKGKGSPRGEPFWFPGVVGEFEKTFLSPIIRIPNPAISSANNEEVFWRVSYVL